MTTLQTGPAVPTGPTGPSGPMSPGSHTADRSRLRVLPVPVSEPRDVRAAPQPLTAGRVGRTQGALALAPPDDPPAARLAPAAAPRRARAARRPVPQLPDPAQLAQALVLAVVEVVTGTRPTSQLLRWTSPSVHAAVCARAAVAMRLRRGDPPSARRARVRAVRTCPVSATAAEVGAVVDDGQRVRAVALRLEAVDGRWRVTALEIG